MRAAPPVSVRGTGGHAWRGVQTLLTALAAAALACWGLSWAEMNPLPALAVLLIAAAPAWRWSRARAVILAWDGQRWTADGTPGRLDVMLDLGNWLLLRLRPDAPGAARWIELTAREAGASMHGLRAAAYARHALPKAADAPPARAAN